MMAHKVQLRLQGEAAAVRMALEGLGSIVTDVGFKENTDGTMRAYGTLHVADEVKPAPKRRRVKGELNVQV